MAMLISNTPALMWLYKISKVIIKHKVYVRSYQIRHQRMAKICNALLPRKTRHSQNLLLRTDKQKWLIKERDTQGLYSIPPSLSERRYKKYNCIHVHVFIFSNPIVTNVNLTQEKRSIIFIMVVTIVTASTSGSHIIVTWSSGHTC